MGAVFVCEVAAMEVSQKKPAAGAPAAKEPAPTLASGKYTFSKAEALRRYVLRKQNKSGKGVSVAKRAEKKLKAQYVEKPFNKGTRVVSLKKRPNNYPVKTLLRKKSKVVKRVGAPKVRKSLTPGTVLILLAGVHRGKRVVLLKSLKSGLLLVTGPYKINRVPVRRVHQHYVIATSTKLDIEKVEVPANID